MLQHLVVHHPSYLTLTTRLGDKNQTPARRPIDLYLPGRGKCQSQSYGDILTHSFTSAVGQIFLASVKQTEETADSSQYIIYLDRMVEGRLGGHQSVECGVSSISTSCWNKESATDYK